MNRLYGYLAKTKDFAIRYRTKDPDYSLTYQSRNMNGPELFYGNLKEEIPKDIPIKPLRKR